jgi:NAD(P)-dependent dehydrogenase (short-subunit alcohol dehydrogenase family)
MTSASTGDRRPVVVVTGGGGGIGAAIAEELGRAGWYVVTVDPLVSLDGSEQLPEPEETTAGRIVAAGGAARASAVSVTDAGAISELFEGLVAELGGLDAVINVAGISRPTGFAKGTEEDWRAVLSVHLDGYRNVLAAALPIMAAAGTGRVLGVTSGSGWRQADAGAYGCAKRAVASLTWQVGQSAPPGVVVNAMSPIAVTRMVTAALGRAAAPSGGGAGPAGSATGGLSLGSMPTPEQLGPIGAHLVSDAFSWCRGEIVFVGGSEVAVVDRPRLLEVVRTEGVGSLAGMLEVVVPSALATAEAEQASGGGSNPRFGSIFADAPPADLAHSEVRTCALDSDRPQVAAAVAAALQARGVACTSIEVAGVAPGFDGAAAALASAAASAPIDAVVVALSGGPVATDAAGWRRTLNEHDGIVDGIHTDAGWARAAADHAAGTDRPVRLVSLTDAVSAGGRSRAQASAQLARAARRATGDRVAAFAVSLETSATADEAVVGELTAHLLCHPDATALAGAELVVGAGWLGLRSHPRPGGSVTFGGPAVPSWLDGALQGITGRHDEEAT